MWVRKQLVSWHVCVLQLSRTFRCYELRMMSLLRGKVCWIVAEFQAVTHDIISRRLLFDAVFAPVFHLFWQLLETQRIIMNAPGIPGIDRNTIVNLPILEIYKTKASWPDCQQFQLIWSYQTKFSKMRFFGIFGCFWKLPSSSTEMEHLYSHKMWWHHERINMNIDDISHIFKTSLSLSLHSTSWHIIRIPFCPLLYLLFAISPENWPLDFQV